MFGMNHKFLYTLSSPLQILHSFFSIGHLHLLIRAFIAIQYKAEFHLIESLCDGLVSRRFLSG